MNLLDLSPIATNTTPELKAETTKNGVNTELFSQQLGNAASEKLKESNDLSGVVEEIVRQVIAALQPQQNTNTTDSSQGTIDTNLNDAESLAGDTLTPINKLDATMLAELEEVSQSALQVELASKQIKLTSDQKNEILQSIRAAFEQHLKSGNESHAQTTAQAQPQLAQHSSIQEAYNYLPTDNKSVKNEQWLTNQSSDELVALEHKLSENIKAALCQKNKGTDQSAIESQNHPKETTGQRIDKNSDRAFDKMISQIVEGGGEEQVDSQPKSSGETRADISVTPTVSPRIAPANFVTNTQRHSVDQQAFETKVVDQVLPKINEMTFPKQNEVVIQLEPAKLGQVRVQLQLDEGNIKATFTTQSAATNEVLEKHIHRLSEAFAENGLKLSFVEVNIDQRQGDQGKPGEELWQALQEEHGNSPKLSQQTEGRTGREKHPSSTNEPVYSISPDGRVNIIA